MMMPKITKAVDTAEFYTEERCFIRELSNSPQDKELSVALARVEKGVTTEWHALKGTVERYLIVKGEAIVELEGLMPSSICSGDMVEIPVGCRQRITNTGDSDLIFYAICTPRFKLENYLGSLHFFP